MIIQEFLPNPIGNDKEGEYILLFNNSDEAVNLAGWSVKDASGKTFKLSGSLSAKAELKLSASLTKIPLNNNGETVSLYDANGKLIDSLSYSGAALEDIPVTRNNELTAEVRAQLFDDLAGKYLPDAHLAIGSNIWLIMIAAGLILAGLSIYILHHVADDPYEL